MKKIDVLNHTRFLIDKLHISNFANSDEPLSENDIAILHLQLTAAQILLADAEMIKREQPTRELQEIIEELSQTWKANIHDFALALSEEQ